MWNDSSAMTDAAGDRPRFVVALVGAVGSLLSETADELETALGKHHYMVKRVRLSDALKFVTEPVANAAEKLCEGEDYFDERHGEYWRVREAMARGTAARTAYGADDANNETKNSCLAALAVHAIARHAERSADPHCVLVHSLKTQAELDLLRKTYGRRLLVVGVHGSKSERQNRLTDRIERNTGRNTKADQHALHLISIDEKELGTSCGQDVRGVFERCDVYVSATRRDDDFHKQIDRLVRLLFLDPFATPTNAEAAMMHAYSASLQSAAMARQVGAALVGRDGEVLATGFNEVPRYSEAPTIHDSVAPDGRDHTRGYDENVVQKRTLVEQLFQLAENNGLLRDGLTAGQAMNDIQGDQTGKDMLHANITEFCREVHAEMMTITTAARRGSSLRGSTLFTTTFPCHNCAKHIIAAGIREVVFIEAYPKSLALSFYSDSLTLDQAHPDKVLVRAFRGVAPRSYGSLFAWRNRRGDDGKVPRTKTAESQPWFVLRSHLDDQELAAREKRVMQETRSLLAKVFQIDDALTVLTKAAKGGVLDGQTQQELFKGEESEAAPAASGAAKRASS